MRRSWQRGWIVAGGVHGIGSRPQQSGCPTFTEYWQLHYVPNRRPAWSEATAAGYEIYRRAYLGPAFGNMPLGDITPTLITRFFNRLRKKRSHEVVRKCWTLLKAVLDEAVDDELLANNATRKIRPPKTREPKQPTLDNATLRRILKAVKDRPLESAVLHVGTFCALRSAELFGLRWQSLQGDSFLIEDSAWRGQLFANETNVGVRRVFIPPATLMAVRRWRQYARFTAPRDILFATKTGTPIRSHNFVSRVLQPLRNRLKLSAPLTFQVLRRSYATRNQGSPKAAHAHLGHKNIATTLNIYVPSSVKAIVTADESRIVRAMPWPAATQARFSCAR